MAQRSDLAVGDNVTFSKADDGTFIVEEVLLPRKTVLSRPDPHDNRVERVIAANIDIVVIVTSVSAPALNTNLIDRYLLAIERGGIEPLICINKIDLLGILDFDKDAFWSFVKQVAPKAATFEISCKTAHGTDAWLDWLGERKQSVTQTRD